MALISIILILLAYLVPSSIIIRPEYFIVFTITAWALMQRGAFITAVFRREIILIFSLSALALITLAAQILINGSFISRDALIILRYFVYSCAIFSGSFLAISSRSTLHMQLLIWLLMSFSITISFIQYFNFLNLNNITAPIYTENYDLLVEGASWRRIIGTFGNPNYWGLLLGLGLIISGHAAIIKKNILAIPFVILLFVSIIMTGSRGALIASIAGLLFSLFISPIKGDKNRGQSRPLIIFMGIFIAAFLAYGYNLFISQYYTNTDRFSIDNTETLQLRMAWWEGFLRRLLESPYQLLIGRGPSKEVEAGWGDNMYLLMLRDFGLIALFFYLYLWFTMYRHIRALRQRTYAEDTTSLTLAASFVICLAIFDLAADSWFYVRLSIPLLFGYGFVITQAHLRISRISS